MTKIPIYELKVFIVNEDIEHDPLSERVISREGFPIKITRFPKGEKYIAFSITYFGKISPSSFIRELLSDPYITKSKAVYTLTLSLGDTLSQDERVIATEKFNDIESSLIEFKNTKVVQKYDKDIYVLNGKEW